MSDMTKAGHIDYAVADGIATITFAHPSHNSLPGRLLEALAQAIARADKDDDARVVVLKSAGDRTFCAGASFDELIAIEDKESGLKFFSGFANVINAMRTCSKLIIGRVQGKAVGGGVGLAAATDYCIATKYAAVKLSELAIGIGPFVVGPAVERKVGTSGLGTLSINASSWQTADWALQHGLYANVYDDIDSLDVAVNELSKKLAASNPEAMTHLKKTLWANTDHWEDLLLERAALSGELVLSDFTRQAIAQFKAKTS